ncbi:MAG: shikimate kinase [Flavobacteriaceae bacterium]|nr:shikimate kinase [Flavobacteriaceae bacterium]
MKIVLLGYMGSGKSAIGKRLASVLSFPFLDLDEYIVEKERMSISDIFAQKGELFFRKIEKKHLEAVLSGDTEFVLSLGGGTPCYYDNMDSIHRFTQNTIYLKASISTLVERLRKERENRPLLSHLKEEDMPEYIGKHLFERNNYYNLATHNVLVDQKKVPELVNEIRQLLV